MPSVEGNKVTNGDQCAKLALVVDVARAVWGSTLGSRGPPRSAPVRPVCRGPDEEATAESVVGTSRKCQVTGWSCRRKRIQKHPFDCSSLRSEQVTLTSFGSRPSLVVDPADALSCGSGCECTLCPSGAKRASITCVQRRSAHRIRGTTLVVGTGGAVRPITLCLSAQGPRWTDPTIAPAFDGLKYSRLSQGRVYRPLPASVVLLQTA